MEFVLCACFLKTLARIISVLFWGYKLEMENLLNNLIHFDERAGLTCSTSMYVLPNMVLNI